MEHTAAHAHHLFDVTFWVAMAFVVFFALLGKKLMTIILSGLDGRSARIAKELEEATRLKEEAKSILALYQRKHHRMMEEADEMLAHAREEAGRIVEQSKAKLDEELNKRTEMALQRIATMEARVMQDIRDQAVDITVSAARRLIMDNLGRDMAEEIISSAITNVQRRFN